MKKGFVFLLILAFQGALLANSEGGVTDILPRTVNFIIFAAIIYYLLADKLKAYFSQRTLSIQTELEKVQNILNESKAKAESAKAEVENSKAIADQIIADAKADIARIEKSIEKSVSEEIENLNKHFDEKIEIETRKAKKEVVEEVLDTMLNSGSLGVSDEEVSKIIIKKVA
jgi:F-type H+-transporting ATPase subunit b